jgi:hypothetical protein
MVKGASGNTRKSRHPWQSVIENRSHPIRQNLFCLGSYMKPLLGTLRELVNDALASGLEGRQIDALVVVSGSNFLSPDKPVPALVIRLSNSESFELFIQDKTVNLLRMDGFVSIFKPVTNGFPVARVYTLDVPDLLEFARIAMSFEERGFRLVPMLPQEFNTSLEAADYETRTVEYCSAQQKKNAGFAGLVDGRLAATFLEQAVLFNSEGCMLCGKDADFVTTTIGDGAGEGMIVGFYICSNHAAEKPDTFFDFLGNKFGHRVSREVIKPSKEFLLGAAANFFQTQLDCKVEINKSTITATRPSGFRIIARLGDRGDYAYVFLDAKGREVTRIDNSDHHNVSYGPDHRHLQPGKDNKNVVSSFTYGFPPVDTKIIRRILAENEL